MLETLRHIRNFSASHQSKRPFPSIQEIRQGLVTRRRGPRRSLRQRPTANQRQGFKSLALPRRGTASRQTMRTAASQNPSKRSQKRLPFRRDEPMGNPYVGRSDVGNRAIQERTRAVRQVFGKKTRRHLLEKAGNGVGMKERPPQAMAPQSAAKRKQVASEKPRRPDPSLLRSDRRLVPNPRKSHARALRKKRLGRIVRNARKARRDGSRPRGETASAAAHRGSLPAAQRGRVESPALPSQSKGPGKLPGSTLPEDFGQGNEDASLKLPGNAIRSNAHRAHDPPSTRNQPRTRGSCKQGAGGFRQDAPDSPRRSIARGGASARRLALALFFELSIASLEHLF